MSNVSDVITKYCHSDGGYIVLSNVFVCTKCGAEMKSGIALYNTLAGMSDFVGSDEVVTVSRTGKAVLVDVYKCKECGYSVSK